MNYEDLLKSSYNFDLPGELIADRPSLKRDESRLLYFENNKNLTKDLGFKNIVDLLPENSTLVLNNSKVFPCRIMAKKITGAKAEIFFLSVKGNKNIPCMIKTSSKKYIGDQFVFGELVFTITEKNKSGVFEVSVEGIKPDDTFESFLFEFGLIPIPPYIRKGESDAADKERYQTVYAKSTGSVAAPTAGLHFTKELLKKLEVRNIKIANVTLHVGLGTFSPVKTENLERHQMHSEEYFIDSEGLEIIKESYSENRPVFTVGTTSLRALESAYESIIDGSFEPNTLHSTNIFIHPGVEVKSITGLITNFHLPESSLLMLVSALVGRKKLLELYQHAVLKNYRFFSYGDAMFIKLK